MLFGHSYNDILSYSDSMLIISAWNIVPKIISLQIISLPCRISHHKLKKQQYHCCLNFNCKSLIINLASTKRDWQDLSVCFSIQLFVLFIILAAHHNLWYLCLLPLTLSKVKISLKESRLTNSYSSTDRWIMVCASKERKSTRLRSWTFSCPLRVPLQHMRGEKTSGLSLLASG